MSAPDSTDVVTITAPAAYRLVTHNGSGATTRSGAPRTPEAASAPDPVVTLLAAQDMALVREYELERDETALSARRGGPAAGSEEPVEINLDVGPAESAAVLVEQDGAYTWVFPDEAQKTRRTRSLNGAGPGETTRLTFRIGEAERTRTAEKRGLKKWMTKLLGKKVRVYVFKFIAAFAVDQAMKFLERHVERGLVLMAGPEASTWRHIPDLAERPWPKKPRILLFVHGTFSSTLGSFGGLSLTREGRAFLEEAGQQYDALIGFDHPTLSEDPVENAIALLQLLSTIRSEEPPVFHAVAYSRGGLVLRSLIELLLPGSEWKGSFERAVLVGATNAGTELAEPDNWHDLINLYTNLTVGASKVLGLVTNTPPAAVLLTGALKSLAAFAKYLATYAVTERAVPGLAAMEPDGDFIRKLNQNQPNQPPPEQLSYYAVLSNFKHAFLSNGRDEDAFRATQLPAKLLLLLADRVIDRLMRTENDLVVHTHSMTAIDEQVKGYVREVCDFGANPVVYHTVYFAQLNTVNAFRKWLLDEEVQPGSGRRRSAKAKAADPFTLPADFRPPSGRATGKGAAKTASPRSAARREQSSLSLEVVWGDLTRAEGDVYAVGHYHGVLPQHAELALDTAISASEDALILTELTRRHMLRGNLGEINFFPWTTSRSSKRSVTVCGMGFPGSYTESEQRVLFRNLAWTLSGFPNLKTLCTVLIGSGQGTLSIGTALRGMLLGLRDGLQAVVSAAPLQHVRIIERDKRKAERILRTLGDAAREVTGFSVQPELSVGDGGVVGDDYYLTRLISAASTASVKRADSRALARLFEIPAEEAAEIRAALQRLQTQEPDRTAGRAQTFDVQVTFEEAHDEAGNAGIPTRISLNAVDSVYRAAAITDTATVPERAIEVDPLLMTEVVRRMTDPDAQHVSRYANLLYRLLVPRDFREILDDGSPIIFEVNREAALVHWEIMAVRTDEPEYIPIGLHRPVARQLRTLYSPPPLLKQYREVRRALVIGDPSAAHPLEGARREAEAVADLLRQKGFDVTALIGTSGARHPYHPPASRLDVLEALLNGSIDVVHYAGHGTYDEKDPRKAGWLFQDGLLTAREIQQVDRAPSLIVANACLSVRTAPADQRLSEANLLPTLADEFFRRGVRNYIGTAWEINDEGAIEFARVLYDRFFSDEDTAPGRFTLGDALLRARQHLAEYPGYGALWAAYQHYGDPNFMETDL